MDTAHRSEFFHGLFELVTSSQGRRQLASRPARTLPDPQTGRPLTVASVEVSDRSICPACAQPGAGAYVSFVSDLRLAFACPSCRQLVWTAGM
jgi:hypothetical protein